MTDSVPAVDIAGWQHRLPHTTRVGSNSCSATPDCVLSGKAFNSFQSQSPQLSNGNNTISGTHLSGALRNGSKPSQGTCHEWMFLMLYFINFLLSRPRFQRVQIKLEATSKCKVGTGRVEEGPVSVRSRASRFWTLLCPPNQRPKDHCLSPPTFTLRGYKNNHLGRTHKGEFQGQGTRSRLLHWVERHRCKVQ